MSVEFNDTISADVNFTDGSWHKTEILRNDTLASVTVDDVFTGWNIPMVTHGAGNGLVMGIYLSGIMFLIALGTNFRPCLLRRMIPMLSSHHSIWSVIYSAPRSVCFVVVLITLSEEQIVLFATSNSIILPFLDKACN